MEVSEDTLINSSERRAFKSAYLFKVTWHHLYSHMTGCGVFFFIERTPRDYLLSLLYLLDVYVDQIWNRSNVYILLKTLNNEHGINKNVFDFEF